MEMEILKNILRKKREDLLDGLDLVDPNKSEVDYGIFKYSLGRVHEIGEVLSMITKSEGVIPK